MKHFRLHTLIQLAKEYDNSIDFYCDCDMDLATRYYTNVVYVTKEDYRAKSYRVMDTIWFYAQNPGFCSLLKLFSGSATEFSEFYRIPLETVEKWEKEEETAPEYLVELIFSDMLLEESEKFLRIKSNDDLLNCDECDDDSEELYFYENNL